MVAPGNCTRLFLYYRIEFRLLPSSPLLRTHGISLKSNPTPCKCIQTSQYYTEPCNAQRYILVHSKSLTLTTVSDSLHWTVAIVFYGVVVNVAQQRGVCGLPFYHNLSRYLVGWEANIVSAHVLYSLLIYLYIPHAYTTTSQTLHKQASVETCCFRAPCLLFSFVFDCVGMCGVLGLVQSYGRMYSNDVVQCLWLLEKDAAANISF